MDVLVILLGQFAGGTQPSTLDVVEYVTLASIGNATDFGNLSAARRHAGAVAGQTEFVVEEELQLL